MAPLPLEAVLARLLALSEPLLAELERRIGAGELSGASEARLHSLSGLAFKLYRSATPLVREIRIADEASRRAGEKLTRSEKAVKLAEWAGAELPDAELSSLILALTQAMEDRRQTP